MRLSISSILFDETAPDMAFKSLFSKYDTDRNGKLDVGEMSALLKNDLGMSGDAVEIYIYMLDTDGDSYISLDEFLVWVKSKEGFKCVNDPTKNYYIQRAIDMFKYYDTDYGHSLDMQEFEKLFVDLGGQMEKCKEAFDMIDIDGNGCISFPEFLRWLNWIDVDEIFS